MCKKKRRGKFIGTYHLVSELRLQKLPHFPFLVTTQLMENHQQHSLCISPSEQSLQLQLILQADGSGSAASWIALVQPCSSMYSLPVLLYLDLVVHWYHLLRWIYWVVDCWLVGLLLRPRLQLSFSSPLLVCLTFGYSLFLHNKISINKETDSKKYSNILKFEDPLERNKRTEKD